MKGILFLLVLIYLLGPHKVVGQHWQANRDSGEYYKSIKDFELAAIHFTKAKVNLPADSQLSLTRLYLAKNIGSSYQTLTENELAIQFYQEARNILAQLRGAFDVEYAAIGNNLGVLYNTTGQFDTAMAFHLHAKEVRKKLLGETDSFYAQSCNNLGALYNDLGRFSEAEPLLMTAKQIRENLYPQKRSPVYAITCVALANLYRNMGQFKKAEALYLEARDIRANLSPQKSTPLYAFSCNILADLYYYMGDYSQAETYYLEAKTIREKINNKGYEFGQTCNNLANLYRELQRYTEAETFALIAKDIYEAKLPEGHASRTIQQNNLGKLYTAMGQFAKAEGYFLQARKAWESTLGRSHPFFIINTEELARLYWKWGKIENAKTFFSLASNLKYAELNKIFSFTNEAEKQAYLENITGAADEYISFYYKTLPQKNASAIAALSFANRNLILSSTQATREAILNSNQPELIKSFEVFIGAKKQLAKLYSLGFEANPAVVKALEAKADSTEKIVSKLSSVFRQSQKTQGLMEVNAQLKKGEAAIEFINFQLHNGRQWTDSSMYAAVIKRKNLPPTLVTLFEQKQLDAIYQKDTSSSVTNLTTRGGYVQNTSATSRLLDSLIWFPLEKHLSNIQRVYLAPAGALHRIAFSALSYNGKQLVSDKYRLVQVNNLTTLGDVSVKRLGPAKNIILYGGITYNEDSTAANTSDKTDVSYTASGSNTTSKSPTIWPSLPGTKKEILQIDSAGKSMNFSTEVISGHAASEASVKNLNGRHSPSILHVASHGFFYPEEEVAPAKEAQAIGQSMYQVSPNPLLRSGLVMAGANRLAGKSSSSEDDGILTAYEVSNLQLPNTALVILSACETALGDIRGSEGVYGLQRAFKMAGVPNLIMSLWKVPDEETAAFMKEFYVGFFSKLSITDAFYNAQQIMKKKYRENPYKWAAWILVR